MNFERFTGERRHKRAQPANMKEGQIVVRENASQSLVYRLESKMRACIENGMAFSVAHEGNKYAIRRDA